MGIIKFVSHYNFSSAETETVGVVIKKRLGCFQHLKSTSLGIRINKSRIPLNVCIDSHMSVFKMNVNLNKKTLYQLNK